MINTSAEYKKTILKNRVLHHETKIEFADGTVITAQDADLYTFKISDNTSNTNSFDIGAAIAKQLELKIDNIEGAYSERNFSGAKITARVGLELSETTEWLKKGIFYAEPGTLSGDTVSVTALDSMTKFDKSYTESKLQYPATLGQIVRDTCSACNVSMSADIASFPQNNFVVTARPSDTSLTFRQVLQYVGEIACLFFKINEDDELTASWYNTSLLESENIKENTETVKVEDYTGTIETDDVVVTGIKVVEESTTDSDTEKNETEYLYGTKGYVLEIKENKLIQDGKGASVAEFVGKKVNGLTFRPLTIKCQGDPAIEAGDIAVVTDRKGKEYKTILTGATYTARALQELLCGAVSPERLSSTRYSKATQVYRELRKTLTQQQSEFSKALEGLKNAMDEKQGLYPVTEKQEDGSNILYFCDKPTRKESKVVIELNAKGWGMSTDGGKTWNAGTLVDGTTITKILNTIGVNADWINTGALTVKDDEENIIFQVDINTKTVTVSGNIFLGNKDNKKGFLKILDKNGNVKTILDKDGIVHFDSENKSAPYHYRSEHCELRIRYKDFEGGGQEVCTASVEFMLAETSLSEEFLKYWMTYGSDAIKITASIKKIVSPGSPNVNGIYALGTFGTGDVDLYFDDVKTPCMKVNIECSYINYGFNNISPRYIAPNYVYLNVDIVY